MPTTPHRNRSNLHMDLTTLSPRPYTPGSYPRVTVFSTPTGLSASRRSSHHSSIIKSPSLSSRTTTHYSSSGDEADDEYAHRNYNWLRIRRALTGRVFLFWLLLFSLFAWYCSRRRPNIGTIKTGVGGFGFRAAFFQDEATKGLQFIPAAHPRIHVCFQPKTMKCC